MFLILIQLYVPTVLFVLDSDSDFLSGLCSSLDFSCSYPNSIPGSSYVPSSFSRSESGSWPNSILVLLLVLVLVPHAVLILVLVIVIVLIMFPSRILILVIYLLLGFRLLFWFLFFTWCWLHFKFWLWVLFSDSCPSCDSDSSSSSFTSFDSAWSSCCDFYLGSDFVSVLCSSLDSSWSYPDSGSGSSCCYSSCSIIDCGFVSISVDGSVLCGHSFSWSYSKSD